MSRIDGTEECRLEVGPGRIENRVRVRIEPI